ncbi:hypothetical protein PGH12_07050 [Chryseobacterium wangxinyae]|uniref:hypothetical protein n=1 Tax=Chryseobacterium sp. CY350 TaxID=2997336 RepID=UPI00226DAD6F|nr:hypothetical protein [Chryseobacterium sp. CY350]MCY0976909.1 hypothetical protein [Chryseobacterium sp. CY350]WBZ96908.1 hypothetical protein PGH12_07050 [Chryseobacterium sp. CY350]
MSKTVKYLINIDHLLPKHDSGSSSDAAATKPCLSQGIAEDLYRKLADQLLNISHWNINAGKLPTKFDLVDSNGKGGHFHAAENLFVKIKMPAPKNKTGNGYDWVVIEKVENYHEENIEYIHLQMRPCPCLDNKGGGIAHFYEQNATNSFILIRSGSDIQLSVHGRNESPNTSNVRLWDMLRNIFVAGGGIFGGSKLQWEDFVNSMIKV